MKARWALAGVLVALATMLAAGSGRGSSVSVGRMRVVSELAAESSPGYAVAYSVRGFGEFGLVFEAKLGDVARAVSSRPIDASFDPIDPRALDIVTYSSCHSNSAPQPPTCALFRQTLVGGIGHEQPLNEPRSAADVDRLPSVYAGVVAFVRDTPQHRGLIYLFDPGTSRLMRLTGGPDQGGSGRPHGLALRANALAFSWSWRSAHSRRWAVMIEVVGGRPRTLLSIDSSQGEVVGPTWDGYRLYFVIARPGASTIYRYTPASRRFDVAPGPPHLARFSIRRLGGFHWIAAWSGAGSHAGCDRKNCVLRVEAIPRFRTARRVP